MAATRGTASVSLAYDNADRRTSLTLPNGIVVEYGYDDDSRLTGLTYKQGGSPIGTLTYAYDVTGQRTSVGGTYARTGLPAALTSATYDNANQIATWGGTSFSYDSNGNWPLLLSSPVLWLSYAAFPRRGPAWKIDWCQPVRLREQQPIAFCRSIGALSRAQGRV